jgi:hypothetical protein
MKQLGRLAAWICAAMVLAVACDAAAATPPALKVGAAVRDVTPTPDMYPLTRAPNVVLPGRVLDPLQVRVIALSSGAATVLLVSTETGRGPYGPQFAEAVARRAHVPVEAVFITATHSHAAPEITERLDYDFGAEAKPSNLQKWGRYVRDQMLSAVDDALAHMQPASVGIGYAQSYINVNRNSAYAKVAADGSATSYQQLGFNGAGVSDRTVAAIRFNGADGKPVAFVAHYAVHGTVMHANTLADGKTAVSADIPGMISTYLEKKYPGSVGIWLSGAAGDQNPIVQNDMYTRDPVTGEFRETFGGDYGLLTYLSRINFADVERALASIDRYRSDARVAFDYAKTTIPGTDGGPYPVSLQLMRIGDIALVGFPGELFSRIGLDLKAASKLKDTLVVNHAWQKADQPTVYTADDASILAGGFGTNAKYQRGHLTPALIGLMNGLIRDTDE